MRQKAQKRTRPPEYATLHQRAGAPGMWQQPRQPKKTRQSKREAGLEESLSRRARLREQRYEEQRRRQWVLAIALVVMLVILITLARCNTS